MFGRFNKQYIGYIVGFVLPIVGVLIEFFTLYRGVKFFAFIEIAWIRGNLTSLLSLALLPNLLIFFIFIWLDKMKSAQGALGATIIWALLVVVIKLM